MHLRSCALDDLHVIRNFVLFEKCLTNLKKNRFLTSGSAMMMRILRSDRVVKLANKLLRTYSPGLLSGSTVTGMVATGPFLSPGALLTWGRGRFPTGDAGKGQKIQD